MTNSKATLSKVIQSKTIQRSVCVSILEATLTCRPRLSYKSHGMLTTQPFL